MKLAKSIELGRACGLSSLDECVLNVEMHATSLFTYGEINKELQELYSDLKEKEPEYFKQHYKVKEKRNER